MPLAEKILTDQGLSSIVGLIRWVIVCTLAVIITVGGWGWSLNNAIKANHSYIRALDAQTMEFQRNANRQHERVENKLDTL